MNPIELLKEKLMEEYSFASMCLDRPKYSDGRFWLDFITEDKALVIDWKEGDKIGVWLENADAAQVFDQYEEAFNYIKSLKIEK